MLQETFKALLITSLAGTALTGVLTLFRPVTKKVFGYMWHYYIWLAVLCVMLLPVRFGVPQISRAAEAPPADAGANHAKERTGTGRDHTKPDERASGSKYCNDTANSRLCRKNHP